MRVQCLCGCGHRFDVPIKAVLAEAARLAEKRKRPVVANARNEIVDLMHNVARGPHMPPVNGNVLSPQELEVKRVRDEEAKDSGNK